MEQGESKEIEVKLETNLMRELHFSVSYTLKPKPLA